MVKSGCSRILADESVTSMLKATADTVTVAAPAITPTMALPPWMWAAHAIQLIAWPTLVLFAWKARGYLQQWLGRAEAMEKEARIAAENTSATKAVVDQIQGNHLTHMEADLKTQTELLTSIDKGIAILVDRGK